MRLPFPARPLTALFALWFAFVLSDPGMLHACPMHGAGHAEMQAGMHGGTASGTSTQHHEASAHTSHGSASHSGVDASSGHGDAAPCSCVGQCCATTAIAPTVGYASVVLPAVVVASAELPRAPAGDAPAVVGLRLPFANGPPGI